MTGDFPVDGVVDAHLYLMPTAHRSDSANARSRNGIDVRLYPDHEDTMATFGCMGVTRFFALTYAHRLGLAADLKAWVP